MFGSLLERLFSRRARRSVYELRGPLIADAETRPSRDLREILTPHGDDHEPAARSGYFQAVERPQVERRCAMSASASSRCCAVGEIGA